MIWSRVFGLHGSLPREGVSESLEYRVQTATAISKAVAACPDAMQWARVHDRARRAHDHEKGIHSRSIKIQHGGETKFLSRSMGDLASS